MNISKAQYRSAFRRFETLMAFIVGSSTIQLLVAEAGEPPPPKDAGYLSKTAEYLSQKWAAISLPAPRQLNQAVFDEKNYLGYNWDALCTFAGRPFDKVVYSAQIVKEKSKNGQTAYLVLSLTNVSARTIRVFPASVAHDLPRVFARNGAGSQLRLTKRGLREYHSSIFAIGNGLEMTIPPGWAAGNVIELTDFYDLSKPDRYTIMASRPYFPRPAPRTAADRPDEVVSNIVVFDNQKANGGSAVTAPQKRNANGGSGHEPKDKEWTDYAKLAGKPIERFALFASTSPTEPNGTTLIVSLRRVEIGDEPWDFRFHCGYYNSDYKLLVRGPDARVVPFVPDAVYRDSLKKRLRPSLEACAPGGGIGCCLPMAKWFDMKAPGDYYVLAVLPRTDDPTRAWVAEPIKIHIAGKPELGQKETAAKGTSENMGGLQ